MQNIAKSYYSIMPATVRYDERIKMQGKLLYSEITALCNQKGYCWAENSYFAELYGVSKRTISRHLSDLEKCGYIIIEIIYKEGTKQIEERRIYINDTPKTAEPQITEADESTYSELVDPIDKNVYTPTTKLSRRIINNNIINNNIYNNQSINQSNNIDEKPIDTIDDTSTYIELVKENLEYDDYMEMLKKNTSTLELYKELYSIICDIVCVKRDTVRIGKQNYPYELVKARFLELNGSHLKYVIQCVKENCSEVKNIRAYLVTALYNSVSTIQSYYSQKRNASTTSKKQPEAKKDKFLNYEQRTWDFEELRKLEREYNMRN